MDAIRAQLKNPLVLGLGSFVAGLIIGLVVLGWWLWPVKYTGAGPRDLRFTEKVEYLRMSMQAFAQNRNAAEAQARYQALGDEADEALQEVVLNPGDLSLDVIQTYSVAIGAVGPGAAVTQGAEVLPTAGTPVAGAQQTAVVPGATQPAGTEAAGGTTRSRSFLSTLLPILCGLTLLLAAGLLVFFFMRNRQPGAPRGAAAVSQGPVAAQPAASWADYPPTSSEEPPIAQFMASYKLGDDLFDDSFSIDSPAGEFMGECGVGISETIGVGEPKKVTAFEVWLFDKNDIQTVTKVLMSRHAYEDDNTRQRLAAKGEPVLVEPGSEVVLETQSLQLAARVVDLGYGDSAMPEDSYFDRFMLELAVWPKA